MSQGLETRVPFLDNDLVDFAMQIPYQLKIGNSARSQLVVDENDLVQKASTRAGISSSGKQILRRSMQPILPKSFANMPKQGFSSPDASWFRGQSMDFVTRKLGDQDSPLYNYLSFQQIQKLISEHMAGKKNRRLLIWSLLNVNEYLEGSSI